MYLTTALYFEAFGIFARLWFLACFCRPSDFFASLDDDGFPDQPRSFTSSVYRLSPFLLGIFPVISKEVRAVNLTFVMWLRSLSSRLEPVSVHCFRSYPLHWALLRANSCARQLRVFCFPGSSRTCDLNHRLASSEASVGRNVALREILGSFIEI